MVFSADDAPGPPSATLIDCALDAIAAARVISLDDVQQRMRGRFRFRDEVIGLWPGEHYRLLAGFVQAIQPDTVIEIGTAEGLSALSMKKSLPLTGTLTTFDIVEWRIYPNSCLVETDFSSGQLRQVVGDISNDALFEGHRNLFANADLIFVDASKDGLFEPELIRKLSSIQFSRAPLIVFDDIRSWKMLSVWRNLAWPKLDLTSFGHWTGTGLCQPPRR